MTRMTNYGVWVDDDGTLNENEKAMVFIKECAGSVGIEVIEGKTAFSIPFMAEVMKRLREKQEPKSEWEHDHEILRAYADGANNVLDKIRAEIDRQEKWLLQAGCTTYNVDIAFSSIKSVLAESEPQAGSEE